MPTRSEIIRAIDEHILDERDRYVLKRHLTDGVHYPQIVEEMDGEWSLSTVQKRAAAALQILHKYIA